ncbi:MAG: nucleotidyltransferase domain-containing protein [Opitutaceae bacterium]|nr:nucleotidyltransferase domain-containing protein [Opitutaceae bacterium]
MKLLHLLFPRVRAEVLRLLFADAGRERHGRDLARQSGLNVKTVQEELEKLSKADLVTSRRDGNRRYFRANAGHPLFADLQQIVLKTAGLRDVLAGALAELKGVEVAFVFGSLASDSGKAASDVDLLIIGDASLRTLAPALRKAGETLRREINPVAMTAAEYKKGRKKHPLLVDILGKPKLFVKGGADELKRFG